MSNIKFGFTDVGNFPQIMIHTEKGGTYSIVDYRKDGEDVDIGRVSVMNGRGMGGGDYIRSRKDIDRHVKNAHETIWINSEERSSIIAFLEMMRY
jgi:hypothetical protein